MKEKHFKTSNQTFKSFVFSKMRTWLPFHVYIKKKCFTQHMVQHVSIASKMLRHFMQSIVSFFPLNYICPFFIKHLSFLFFQITLPDILWPFLSSDSLLEDLYIQFNIHSNMYIFLQHFNMCSCLFLIIHIRFYFLKCLYNLSLPLFIVFMIHYKHMKNKPVIRSIFTQNVQVG